MRTMTKMFVGVATVIAFAGGGLATAGTGFAATERAAQPVASAESVTVLAVENLGLNSTQAKKLQRDLKANWGYTGAIDGQLGTESWKAMQRFLRAHWGYNDRIDGAVGPNTVKALQRWLKANWGYTGDIDGDAGEGTRAALKRYCNS
ncbi:peptidoglycan-binding domain-containing protein [Streptomyces bikiniensis]|uniref:peptidoglycan-binding domain-containing protein n=1 Tax=Streptomyces bikiniensis TaxID=1896 RepID=UPI0004C16C2D|nr:peptidoglycan-binding domain-containing protein [Streptomyces bikiniensis]